MVIIDTELNTNLNNNIVVDSNEKNHNDLLLELEEIKNLYSKIEQVFLNYDNNNNNNYVNNNNNYDNSITFNYNFKKEYAGGFIEYKRTLSSYANTKVDKLIRQIYWRIYEGIVTENINICYYIIGLEDSGIPSRISKEELEISIKIISDAMKNQDIYHRYLYFINTELNYNFVIVKFILDDKIKKIEYF